MFSSSLLNVVIKLIEKFRLEFDQDFHLKVTNRVSSILALLRNFVNRYLKKMLVKKYLKDLCLTNCPLLKVLQTSVCVPISRVKSLVYCVYRCITLSKLKNCNCHKSVLSFDERSQLFPLKWKMLRVPGAEEAELEEGWGQSRICLSASKIPTSFKLVSTSFINFFLKFFSKFETFSEFAGQNLDLQRRITVSVVY